MTQDEIIRMAREVDAITGLIGRWIFLDAAHLERFAALVAAHERKKLAEQEPFDMDDHPPHRLCECRKCMEYFTPLPDCDAFAASGKPIAEQTNTQFMEGFRPVSEMIAEHKQDPKKAAAIEKAKMRKAEQKPVAVVEITYGREPECYVTGNIDDFPEGVFKLYASPVRTKDLTDDEIKQEHEQVEKFLEDNLVVESEHVNKSGYRVLQIREDELMRIIQQYTAHTGVPKHEPIGEVDIHMDFLRINWKDGRHPPKGTKLYTNPVRTKDLTDAHIGGKWGDGWACPVCGGSNSGALLKCRSCEYKRPADDEIKGWWPKTSSSIAV